MRRLWLNSAFRTPHFTIAHLNHELARTILCCTCNKQLSRWRRGSWKASFRFCARIGTMNRCASQRRGPDRGSATRSLLGSWRTQFRRSEEHTSELQSHSDLVCRLLLEKKKK